MASIRSEGFALSRDQAGVGASAIAATVWTAGSVQGSVEVAVPDQRFDDATNVDLAGEVMRAGEVVSRRVGDPLSVVDGAR
jgi:DNA-binding IclR family transcriptional regulator